MKRIFYFIILIAVSISFASCKSDSGTNVKVDSNIAATEIDASETTEKTSSEIDTGGLELAEYRNKYEFSFYGVESRFADLVPKDKFEQWLNQFKHINPSSNREASEHNILNFIKEFNISKEDFIKANYVNPENKFYSDEQIEALFSGDLKAINSVFANPYALYCNGEIYTQEWLDNHTAEEYAKAGIKPSDLEKIVKQRESRVGKERAESLSKKLDELLKLNNDIRETPGKTTSSETSHAETSSSETPPAKDGLYCAATSSEIHNETSVTN